MPNDPRNAGLLDVSSEDRMRGRVGLEKNEIGLFFFYQGGYSRINIVRVGLIVAQAFL